MAPLKRPCRCLPPLSSKPRGSTSSCLRWSFLVSVDTRSAAGTASSARNVASRLPLSSRSQQSLIRALAESLVSTAAFRSLSPRAASPRWFLSGSRVRDHHSTARRPPLQCSLPLRLHMSRSHPGRELSGEHEQHTEFSVDLDRMIYCMLIPRHLMSVPYAPDVGARAR